MEGVVKKTSKQPGKTVAIFGGVHGNEGVGVEALYWAIKNIEPVRGSIYFIEANPIAIKKNIRQVSKNLNRCFLSNNNGNSYEDIRARELMAILNECDALLDIHASNTKIATPFIICEYNVLELAEKLNFSIISTGWNNIESGGTDGYMFLMGKQALCIECGSVFEMKKNIAIAKDSIKKYLQYFGIINGKISNSNIPKRYISVYKTIIKENKNDKIIFSKDYKDFELLESGAAFVNIGEKSYYAKKGDCIIFPRTNTEIGSEIFILGKENKE